MILLHLNLVRAYLPCGVLPRSFVAKAPLDDNKDEKEKTLWNSVYSVVKENQWWKKICGEKTKKLGKHLQIQKKVVPLHRFWKEALLKRSFGEMAEWSIAAVLKTVVLRGTGGSNPSLSAEEMENIRSSFELLFFIPIPTLNPEPFPSFLVTLKNNKRRRIWITTSGKWSGSWSLHFCCWFTSWPYVWTAEK